MRRVFFALFSELLRSTLVQLETSFVGELLATLGELCRRRRVGWGGQGGHTITLAHRVSLQAGGGGAGRPHNYARLSYGSAARNTCMITHV